MLSQQLIESALWLTGKTIEDMEEFKIPKWKYYDFGVMRFSIEKFSYYLLSQEFIKNYKECPGNYAMNMEIDFLYAIQDYQVWEEQHLIDLLSKIK